MRAIITKDIKSEEIKEILLSEIFIATRAREKMGAIAELRADISEVGLINPITVKYLKMAIPKTGEKYMLLAGGRRLQAITELGWKEVTANIYPATISPLEERYIELIENVSRKEMEYEEECALKNSIHQLKVKMAGGAKTGGKQTWEGHSMADTAKIFNESPTQTSADIELAKAIEEIPELGKMKNKTEAMKVWNKMKETLVLTELAQRVEAKRPVKPEERAKKDLIDSYIVGDTFELIAYEEPNTCNLVELDTPFGIALNQGGTKRGTTGIETYTEWSPEEYMAKLPILLEESYRVLRQNGWVIVWFAQEPWYNFVIKSIREAGFNCNGIAGIWSKKIGQTNWPDRNFGSSYEMFFYAYKGKARLAREGRLNLFDYSPASIKHITHFTTKPIGMYQDLLSCFVKPGDNVLVPCLGSGNALLALANLGIDGRGYDSEQQHKDGFIWQVESGKIGEFTSYKKEKK